MSIVLYAIFKLILDYSILLTTKQSMSNYKDLWKRAYQKSLLVDSPTLSQSPSTPATKRQRLKSFTTRLHR